MSQKTTQHSWCRLVQDLLLDNGSIHDIMVC